MKKAIVIGSGIAGIATALRLRKKKYDVIVIEASDKAGGKLGVVKSSNYRWDAGPSLLTMPYLIDELFSLYGENPREFFNYKEKQTICNYFWEDGSFFSAKQPIEKFIEDAVDEFYVDEQQLNSYLKNSREKYQLTAPLFLNRSLHKVKTYLSWSTLKAIIKLRSLDVNQTLDEVNRSYFKDPRLIQLFNRFATYNGSSPFQTPGIMSMIPTLEMQFGTYFPTLGMRSIVDSLFELSQRNKITFNFNEKVKLIQYEGKKVTGLSTNKGFYPADLVVSNMDVYYTYKNLLPEIQVPEKSIGQEKSSSALIFYWGVKKEFPKLDLHNIFFSSDYTTEFSYLFEKRKVFNDPTIYINISSKEKPSDAPSGSENWFVMVNVPSNTGQDWEKIKEKTKHNIFNKLNRLLDVDLESLIETEEILDPIKIESKTSSHQGALYGTASNSKYAAFFRHPNFSNKLSNLYFCGGSVHPGGGIPLCLNSAKIVSNLIPEA